MNSFEQNHTEEIARILAKYPEDRRESAVMPLLHIVQQENGYISKQAVVEIAEIVGLSPTQVASVVGFYTLYHDHPGGKYRFQVCTDLPCALRGADEFLAQLCKALDIKPGETTKDGLITVEEVKCLAACHRAPLFQVQGADGITYYEDQSTLSALALVETLKKKEAGK